jgi:hypothetical protein
LAHILTLEAARSAHACPLNQQQQGGSSRFYAAVAEGVALIGEAEPTLVQLEDSAVVKLSIQTQTLTTELRFISSLILTPAWVSLVHFYSQVS